MDEFYKKTYPLNTGHKLNVRKTFSRRPVNVFCTLNSHLCPRDTIFFEDLLLYYARKGIQVFEGRITHS